MISKKPPNHIYKSTNAIRPTSRQIAFTNLFIIVIITALNPTLASAKKRNPLEHRARALYREGNRLYRLATEIPAKETNYDKLTAKPKEQRREEQSKFLYLALHHFNESCRLNRHYVALFKAAKCFDELGFLKEAVQLFKQYEPAWLEATSRYKRVPRDKEEKYQKVKEYVDRRLRELEAMLASMRRSKELLIKGKENKSLEVLYNAYEISRSPRFKAAMALAHEAMGQPGNAEKDLEDARKIWIEYKNTIFDFKEHLKSSLPRLMDGVVDISYHSVEASRQIRELTKNIEALNKRWAKLTIRSPEAGVLVQVDGIKVGRTPLKEEFLNLRQGKHIIVGSKKGFKTENYEITLKPSEYNPITITLQQDLNRIA